MVSQCGSVGFTIMGKTADQFSSVGVYPNDARNVPYRPTSVSGDIYLEIQFLTDAKKDRDYGIKQINKNKDNCVLLLSK